MTGNLRIYDRSLIDWQMEFGKSRRVLYYGLGDIHDPPPASKSAAEAVLDATEE